MRRTIPAGPVRVALPAILLLASWSLLAPPTAEARRQKRDVFRNGGFEDGTSGWNVLNMSGGLTLVPDRGTKHEGEQSLRVEKSGPGRWDFVKQSQALPPDARSVEVAVRYRVAKGGRLDVDIWFGGAGDRMYPVVASGKTKGKGFKKATEKIEVPDGAATVGMDVKVTAAGTFWIDAVEVVVDGEYPDPGELLNTGFEEGLTGWELLPLGSGAATASIDEKDSDEGKRSLKILRTSSRLRPEDVWAQTTDLAPGSKRAVLRLRTRIRDGARATGLLQALDGDGRPLGAARAPPVETTGEEAVWVDCEVALDLPEGAAALLVGLVVQGPGAVWFDGVELVVE